MPMGSYIDFASCLKDQMKKGHSKLVAQKICGTIKAKTEGTHEMEDKTNWESVK